MRCIHKKCSGLKGRLTDNLDYECKTCTDCIVDKDDIGELGVLDLGNGMTVEKVSGFCYLGDMINADGSADMAVEARVRNGWNKFRELSSILKGNFISWKAKGRMYDSCVRRCMLYACETWPLTERNLDRLVKTDRKMIRCMCGITWKDRKNSKDVLKEVGLVDVKDVIRRSRLRWFGHMMRKEDDDWVELCMSQEVTGSRRRGRPKKTWKENVESDLKSLCLKKSDTIDRCEWRRNIWGKG